MSTDLICARHIRSLAVVFPGATPGLVLTFHLVLLLSGHSCECRRMIYMKSSSRESSVSKVMNKSHGRLMAKQQWRTCALRQRHCRRSDHARLSPHRFRHYKGRKKEIKKFQEVLILSNFHRTSLSHGTGEVAVPQKILSWRVQEFSSPASRQHFPMISSRNTFQVVSMSQTPMYCPSAELGSLGSRTRRWPSKLLAISIGLMSKCPRSQ